MPTKFFKPGARLRRPAVGVRLVYCNCFRKSVCVPIYVPMYLCTYLPMFVRTRDPPIMLIILPIMLCRTAQNFVYCAQINAQYLPIMLKLCSIFITQFPCFSSKFAL